MGKKIFEQVASDKITHSAFDISREVKLTCNMGKLIPIMCEPIIPTDHFKVNTDILMRMAPMIAPIMHKVDVYVHYFFVPCRLVFSQWEEFITGGKLGTSVISMPQVDIRNGKNTASPDGGIPDYFGLPSIRPTETMNAASHLVCALPFRAYTLIYNEYYRDQNHSDPIDFTHANYLDPDLAESFPKVLDRAWEKDYFTSALSNPQRGTAVTMPLTATVNITYLNQSLVKDAIGGGPSDGDLNADVGDLDADTTSVRIENIDTALITGATTLISDLRQSSRLQEFFEKAARAGSRYIEQLAAYFPGANPGDQRLQRPQYLGGGKKPLNVTEVLSQSQSQEFDSDDITNPVGQMAGHGITAGSINGFTQKFQEHGYLIALLSVLPKTNYYQGVPRHFSWDDRFDLFFPEFQNVGEQAILDQELFLDLTAATSEITTFGYQQHDAHFKYGRSTTHGEFRGSLNFWTMARDVSTDHTLNENFVMSTPATNIYSVQEVGTHHLYVYCYHQVHARRPMEHFSNPRL